MDKKTMEILYLDCSMGAAGDMLAAALLDLLPNQEEFLQEINGLGIPGIRVQSEKSIKCGITGIHFSVLVKGEEEDCEGHIHQSTHWHTHQHTHQHIHQHSHHHSTLHQIEHLVCDHLKLPDKVKKDIMAVYEMLAQAESRAHNVPVTDIHFHEVGTMDAVADITTVCLLMHRLAPDRVVVSPIHVGSGQVRCAHGILPVPAPATADLLQGVPVYGGEIQGELCTPTGAALLKYFASSFQSLPLMSVEAIGYGMGKKDFPAANCVRALWGKAEASGGLEDKVVELSCNLDDMTAEEIGFAMERLLEGGALEVYTLPIGMKKSRPGILLSVLCQDEKKDTIMKLLFRHTTTIGIREKEVSRYILKRNIEEWETPYGSVRRKISTGYGVSKTKYEYEDLAAIARERNLSLREAAALLEDNSSVGFHTSCTDWMKK